MIKMRMGEDDIVECKAIRLDIISHIGLFLCTRVDDNTAFVFLVDEQVGVRRNWDVVEPQDFNVIAEYILHRW